jgi:hypothetical protein
MGEINAEKETINILKIERIDNSIINNGWENKIDEIRRSLYSSETKFFVSFIDSGTFDNHSIPLKRSFAKLNEKLNLIIS